MISKERRRILKSMPVENNLETFHSVIAEIGKTPAKYWF